MSKLLEDTKTFLLRCQFCKNFGGLTCQLDNQYKVHNNFDKACDKYELEIDSITNYIINEMESIFKTMKRQINELVMYKIAYIMELIKRKEIK